MPEATHSQYPEPCNAVQTWCESRALSHKPYLIATCGRGRAEEGVKNPPFADGSAMQSITTLDVRRGQKRERGTSGRWTQSAARRARRGVCLGPHAFPGTA